jgi:uncharacterized metal-binding protein
MSGDTLVQIVTIVVGGIVAIVTLLVRADVNKLKAEITELRQTVASAHALILRQNDQITALAASNSDLAQQNLKVDIHPQKTKPEPYVGNPPYRKGE